MGTALPRDLCLTHLQSVDVTGTLSMPTQRTIAWPLLVSSFLLALDSQPVLAQQIEVWPEEVVLSPDYPARIVVLEKQTADSSFDRTRSEKLQLSCDRSIGLSFSPDGLITTTNQGTAEGATGYLVVTYGSEQRRVPLRIAPGNSLSPTFPREIAAVLGKSGCNLGTCHGNLHGKAGFRLSLRGDDPVLDYGSIVRGAVGRRIDRFQPSNSLLIRKPLGEVAHQGGVRFDHDSIEAKIMAQWIKEGAQWNAVTGAACPTSEDEARADETLLSIQVYPPHAVLAKSCRTQQLVVIARFADGTRRDVTRWARFEPSVVTGVEVDTNGLVTAADPVDVAISISYLTGRAASRLTFLAHESSPIPETTTDSRLDQLVEQQLRKLQSRPSEMADDYVFIRRAFLSIVGRLPTADEVRAFAQSSQADKRSRLTESLLHDPGYALMWSMRWSDLLRNEQKVMSQRGAEGWHAWITEQIAQDRPLDRFVAEMLTTLGSTYDHPAASFHRTHRDPETAAESIGQVFLGVRLQCARCHNHPFDSWRQDDYYGLAAYFTTLQRKQLENSPKDKFDKHIISGDEVVSLSTDTAAEIWHPGRAIKVGPKPLTQSMADQKSCASSEDIASKMPLEHLAKWLTVDNRLFARNMANRIWFHIMGVGIVDPPDDFRDSNPASNPELLEYLTDELIRSDYSTRHVARLIVSSRTFQRQSASEPSAAEPLGGPRVFSGYPLRRMPAEVLYDAISDVTGVLTPPGEEVSTTLQARAVARVDVPTKAGFLSTFGKPGRLLVCECERSSDVSLGQSLVLVNGLETRDKLAKSDNCLSRLTENEAPLEQIIDSIYLATLARPPRSEEVIHFGEYVATAPSKRAALEDVLWALLNSKEFPLIR